MARLLEAALEPARYKHSLNVMDESVRLAKLHGLDVEKARIAGLVHDCGREVKKKDSAAAAEKLGLSVLPVERSQPILLHAPIGAVLAREKYGITDKDILKAVALHTTGGRGMGGLDMVVFVADLIEPGRTQPGVARVRELAGVDLELATLEALRSTMDYLLANGFLLHPACLECWNDILLKRERGFADK